MLVLTPACPAPQHGKYLEDQHRIIHLVADRERRSTACMQDQFDDKRRGILEVRPRV